MPPVGHRPMLDLNDLRVFERVGALRSFSSAALALAQPKSTVSRSIARLEAALGTRLIQRTTREVELTPAGDMLLRRCAAALGDLGEALDYVGSLATEAQGELRLSVGIGFGINVLGETLPEFLRRYPRINVSLDLTSRLAELVSERIDVAIRLGPLPDSSMVAVRLGEMKRALCAAPEYLKRKGTPMTLDDLAAHDLIEMPAADSGLRTWSFFREGETREVAFEPRASINDALTINRLILNGAGIGIISCYICAPEIDAGRLVHLLPQWTPPMVGVNLVFPSKRELAPAVRAFVEFMKETSAPGMLWQNNDL